MSSNYLALNPSKTKFLLIGLPQQTSKIVNPSRFLPITTKPIMVSLCAKNLGFISDSTLSFSKQISSFFSACHYHIRDLRRFQHTLDSTTANTVATALVHSRLDYFNSLYHGLPITQIMRLQHSNGLARAVTRTQKYSHICSVLKSLHWLKVEQRIQYKIISITHNLLHIAEPKYLHRLINIKPPGRTRSSDHLCLSLPPVSSRLKFADRSFRNFSPRLWNFLPINLRSFAPDTYHSTTVTSSTPSLPCRALFLSRNQCLSCLKTHLFTLSYPP